MQDLMTNISSSSVEYNQKEALLNVVSSKVTIEGKGDYVGELVQDTINQM